MAPQLGTVAGRLKPRKLSEASAMITPPMLMLNTTMTGGAMLGRTCPTTGLTVWLRQRQLGAEGREWQDAGVGICVAEVGRAQVHLIEARNDAALAYVAAGR